MSVYLITLFRGCTATGDIAGSCLQGSGQSGSAALPASVIEISVGELVFSITTYHPFTCTEFREPMWLDLNLFR
jgi:hypothetical protein